jgi:hypothetical protein
MDDRIVILRTFPNEFEAELARTILEANEIPAMVLRDDAGGMYPSLTFIHGVRLVVHRDDVQEALEILEHTGEEEPGEPEAQWESDSAWEGDSFD